jgi:hypothetical protein
MRFFDAHLVPVGFVFISLVACSSSLAGSSGDDPNPSGGSTSDADSPSAASNTNGGASGPSRSMSGSPGSSGAQSGTPSNRGSEGPSPSGAFVGAGGSAAASPGGIGSGTSAGPGSVGSPAIPAVSGDCPTFATGTVSVGGLGNISLQVGPKQSGTGSLVFYWHGTGSNAGEVNLLLPAQARQDILSSGGIIVSFGATTGTGGDCSGTATFSKDDFAIADQIAACAVRDYGIDPTRIYTTGCSAGGLQAGCMGALRSSYIAAVVPNSGGEVFQLPIEDAAHVPSVMTMHGGSSDMVVVAFSQTSATYDTQMKKAGGFVVNCDHGGGHCQAPAALYNAGWEFMKAHPFGVEPEPFAAGLPASFPSFCSTF